MSRAEPTGAEDTARLGRVALLLRSDPEPTETKNGLALMAIGLYALLLNAGLLPRAAPSPPGALLGLLGPWVLLLHLAVVCLGVVQVGAVHRNLLAERKLCAALSGLWWGFATGQALLVVGLDGRPIFYALACVACWWCTWRLTRRGVALQR